MLPNIVRYLRLSYKTMNIYISRPTANVNLLVKLAVTLLKYFLSHYNIFNIVLTLEKVEQNINQGSL